MLWYQTSDSMTFIWASHSAHASQLCCAWPSSHACATLRDATFGHAINGRLVGLQCSANASQRLNRVCLLRLALSPEWRCSLLKPIYPWSPFQVYHNCIVSGFLLWWMWRQTPLDINCFLSLPCGRYKCSARLKEVLLRSAARQDMLEGSMSPSLSAAQHGGRRV